MFNNQNKPQLQPKPKIADKMKIFSQSTEKENECEVKVVPKPRTSIKKRNAAMKFIDDDDSTTSNHNAGHSSHTSVATTQAATFQTTKPSAAVAAATTATLQQAPPPTDDDEMLINIAKPQNAVITFDDQDDDNNFVGNNDGLDGSKEDFLNSSFYSSSSYQMTLPKNNEEKIIFYKPQTSEKFQSERHTSDGCLPATKEFNNDSNVPNIVKKSPSKRVSKTDDDVFSCTSSSVQRNYSSCWKSEEILSLEPVASIENMFDVDSNFGNDANDYPTMSRIEPSPEKFIDEIIRIRKSMDVGHKFTDKSLGGFQSEPRLSNFIPKLDDDEEDDGGGCGNGGGVNKDAICGGKKNSKVEYANLLDGKMIGQQDYVNLNPVDFSKICDEEKVRKMNAFFGETKDTATPLETQIFTSLISGHALKQFSDRQPLKQQQQQQKGRRSLKSKNNPTENASGPAQLVHDLVMVKKKAIKEGVKFLNKSIENLSSSRPALDWSSWKQKLMKVMKGPQGHQHAKASFVVDTFGVPIHMCPMSSARDHQHIPAIVEFCVGVVESLGISNKGIYRIPGNNAGVNELIAELNKDPDMINFENDRWMDVNVVGSLLKLFFRKLPEPLMSYELYDLAIQISRISNHEKKLLKLKSLLVELPITNRETFKFLANHLHRIAENEPENKMNAHNLAIMFGPSLVHPQSDDPHNELTNQMIADMNLQTHIVELIIIYSEWLFSDWTDEAGLPAVIEGCSTFLSADNNNNHNNNNSSNNNNNPNNSLQLLPSTEALLALKSKDLDLDPPEDSSSLAFFRQGILRLSNRSVKSKNKLTKVDSSPAAAAAALDSTNQVQDEEKEVILKKLNVLTRSYYMWKNRSVASDEMTGKERYVFSTGGDGNNQPSSANLKRNLTKKYASNELEISAPINSSHPSLIEKQNLEKLGVNRDDSFSSIKRYPAYSFKNSTITRRDGRGEVKGEGNYSPQTSSSSSLSINKYAANECASYADDNSVRNFPTTCSDLFLSRLDSQQGGHRNLMESESCDGMMYSSSRRKESFVVNNPHGRRYFVPSSTDSVSLFLHSSNRALSRSEVRRSVLSSNSNPPEDGDYENFDVIARSQPVPSLFLETQNPLDIPLCKYNDRKRAF